MSKTDIQPGERLLKEIFFSPENRPSSKAEAAKAQLAKLDEKFGLNQGAAKERAKLRRIIIAAGS